MATYRKLLKNRAGDTIIPVVDTIGDYSTSEVDTGYHWIDGKKIYKKTFVVSIPNSGEGINVTHNISNLDLYIKYEGSIVWSNGNTTRAIPSSYIENGSFLGGYHITCQLGAKTATTFGINYGTAFRGGTAYITLYYTKTS